MKMTTKTWTAAVLSASLFFQTICSVLPLSVMAEEKTYTVKDLFSMQIPASSTITISDRDDLIQLDRYIERGMLHLEDSYTFRLENDIALSDYTFERQEDLSTISIYQNETLAAVYDEKTEAFYTDTSCETPCDFSFEGDSWNPIGDDDNPFYGVFDGNGHRITGLLNTAGTVFQQTDLGLFVSLKQAEVKNLTIDGAFVSVRYDPSDPDYFPLSYMAAGILASTSCYSYLQDCSLENAFVSVSGASANVIDIGGLFGSSCEDSFKNITVDASVLLHADRSANADSLTDPVQISRNCGMLTGSYTNKDPSFTLVFQDCSTTGHITDADTASCVGGFCGAINNNVYMVNSTNHADLYSACIAGGLVGRAGLQPVSSASAFLPPLYMNHCRNTASISGIYAGGIVGVSSDQTFFYSPDASLSTTNPLTVLTGCENTGSIFASSRGGGILAQGISPYLRDCSNEGAIENTAMPDSFKNITAVCLNYDSIFDKKDYHTLLTTDLQNIQETASAMGGLIGQSYYNTYVYNSYNSGNLITKSAICGGLIGRTTEEYAEGCLTLENCFHSGSIAKTEDSSTSVVRPVLTASLIGYCYNDTFLRNISYCYSTQPELSFCGYWPNSLFSGEALSVSPVEETYCSVISAQQLNGTEASRNIGDASYNSYPDLLSCLNAWVDNRENMKRLYLAEYPYSTETPASWENGSTHPLLILQNVPGPLTTTEPVPIVTPYASQQFEESPSPAAQVTSTAAASAIPPQESLIPAASPSCAAPSPSAIPPSAFSPAPRPTEVPVIPTTTPPTTRQPNVVLPTIPTDTPTASPAAPNSSSPSSHPDHASVSAARLTLIRTTSDRGGGIRIVWKCTKSYDGYQIYRSSHKKKGFRPIATVSTSKKNKYFSQAKTKNNIRCTYRDTTTSPNSTYYYRIIPYTLDGTKKTHGTFSNTKKAVSRLMAPVLTVQRRQNNAGQRYLRIKLRRYQGRYADIYIRKNNKKYTLLQLRNDNIRQQKATFDLHYTFRRATIAVKLQTFQTKKRVNGSFYSKETVLQIND